MKIAVINGSPKGNELSGTMQYFYFMQKAVPGIDYEIFPVAEKIKRIEGNPASFQEVLDGIKQCDAVLWVTPVYFCVIPGQIKRFIELVFEQQREDAFQGKHASAVITSIHFFDHAALNYLQAISEDLGMRFVPGFSAGMPDLLEKKYRESVKNYFKNFISVAENQEPVPRKFDPVVGDIPEYRTLEMKETPKSSTKRTLILTDHRPDTNLAHMVETYLASSRYEVDVINLHEINIKGPCLGCCQCAFESVCVYQDDMRWVYREKIASADAIIFAGSIVDRYLSSRWKTFYDRSFFNGHKPVFWGKQVGFLVSGPLRQNPNIAQIMEGPTSYAKAEWVGTVTDEDDQDTTFRHIQQLAGNVDRKLEQGGVFQDTIFSKAGHLIFRDMVYNMGFVFKSDHLFYKQKNLYDFPQKDYKARALNLFLGMLFRIPPIGKAAKRDLKKHMIMPLQKVVNKES